MRYQSIFVSAIASALVLGAGPALAEGEDEFVITAQQRSQPLREVGSSISVVTAEELEAQGIIYVEEALRQLPGVQASASGGAGGQVAVRLRGEESYRTLVLIDGIRVSDPSLPQAATNFGNMTVAGIERIEVLRGPQALHYGGDALGGVVNIVTRRGSGQGAHLTAEYGTHDTSLARAGFGTSANNMDLALTASYFRTDGFSAKTDPTLDDDDAYRNFTFHGVAGVDISEGTRAEVVARYMDAYTQFDGFWGDPDRDLLTDEYAVRASLTTSDLGAGLTHTFAYNFFRTERDDLDGGLPTVDYFLSPISVFDGDRHEVEYLGQLASANGHGFMFGAEYLSEEVLTDSLDVETSSAAAFAEWQAEWAPNLFSTVGVRFDAPEDYDSHLSFRATAAWLVPLLGADDTKLRASFGTGFRAPSAFERATNALALLPELKEETAFGFDVGTDVPFGGVRGQFSVTYFNQTIEDEIRYDNVGFTGYFQSSGETRSQGIEVGIDYDLGNGFSLGGTYTYTDATVNSPDPEDGLQRVRRPSHLASASIDYVGLDDRLRVNLNVRSSADQEDGFREFRTPLDDYVVAGAAASFAITERVDLTARVTNLFDEDYTEVAGFNTAGRMAYVGMRLEL